MRLEPPPDAPRSEPELLDRARALAGRTLGEVARRLHLLVPRDLRCHKGWVGQALEVALGARAGSRPVPDFEHLGVELKTLPIGANGRPRESTFVGVIPVDELYGMTWETSHCRRKLQRVLWVPVQADPAVALAERRVGTPLIWSCDWAPDAATLRADWERHTERIRLGEIDAISARDGAALQVRPKALSGRERRLVIGEDGWLAPTLPRGFYLRARFTAGLLARHYAPADPAPP
ncbi:MAG: DNA mismatch repair endonuclease MutH [Proteobacteria bacterium]|nr:MAG: DNA mismatch repair endonuclease MutH [Pseudomonadota bacterium]